MFFPAVYSWFPSPLNLPTVLTLHDAIAEHFPDLVFPDKRGRLLWAIKMKLARWQASRVMTVSNAAKQEIVEYLKVKADCIDVLSEAADARFKPVVDANQRTDARKRANLPVDARMIVYVGGLAPHKNIPGLLKAFTQTMDEGGVEDVHIALVGDIAGGGFHSHYEELAAMVRADDRLARRVHFTGFVTDNDLVALYSDALAVCLPSFSEGFGLPAIEAMACGVPVLASTQGAIPEVVGDAGIYFDPYNIDQFAAAIHRIASETDTLEQLRKKASERAATFTWANAARLTIASLEKAAG